MNGLVTLPADPCDIGEFTLGPKEGAAAAADLGNRSPTPADGKSGRNDVAASFARKDGLSPNVIVSDPGFVGFASIRVESICVFNGSRPPASPGMLVPGNDRG